VLLLKFEKRPALCFRALPSENTISGMARQFPGQSAPQGTVRIVSNVRTGSGRAFRRSRRPQRAWDRRKHDQVSLFLCWGKLWQQLQVRRYDRWEEITRPEFRL